MKVIIFPSKISGKISAPPSKSYTHRAIILATLAQGKSVIKNALNSLDIQATIEACKLLGSEIAVKQNLIAIEGVGGRFAKKSKPIEINCGLSGTTIRLLTAVAALSPNEIILTGEKRLRERPIGELVRALKNLGVDISAENNQFPPVKIKGGKFAGGKITISGEISSQYISALLIIAPYATNDTKITVTNLKSAPYVDITLDLMKTFGVDVQVNNKYFIKANQQYKSREYVVEGDYSSASYFFAASFLTDSKIDVANLNPNSAQGDKHFLEILAKLKNDKTARDFDLGNYPDIVPTVAICAANSTGVTEITNIAHLRKKETDRIAAIAKELQKMSIETIEKKDSLTICGGRLKGASIDTYNDHRIAMSFAIAGLAGEGKTIINNAEVVNKSYPNFWKDLKRVGANLTSNTGLQPENNTVL